MESIIVVWIVAGVCFGALGTWIASAKGRSEGEGFVLGFMFGPLGCLIEALLPNQVSAPIAPEQALQAAEAREKAAEKHRRHMQDLDAALEARNSKHIAMITAERRIAAQRSAEFRRQAWAWFDRVFIQFGWFHDLPETAKPIFVGLAISAPAIMVIAKLFNR